MPNETPHVVWVHHADMEGHATSWNEGYEAAVAQGLADDPTLAQEWLESRDDRIRAEAARAIQREILEQRTDRGTREIGVMWRNGMVDSARIAGAMAAQWEAGYPEPDPCQHDSYTGSRCDTCQAPYAPKRPRYIVTSRHALDNPSKIAVYSPCRGVWAVGRGTGYIGDRTTYLEALALAVKVAGRTRAEQVMNHG